MIMYYYDRRHHHHVHHHSLVVEVVDLLHVAEDDVEFSSDARWEFRLRRVLHWPQVALDTRAQIVDVRSFGLQQFGHDELLTPR